MRKRPHIAVRWTIGDVSAHGFEALRLSIWGAWRVFGPRALYGVCVNSIPLDVARARTGDVPVSVLWHDAGGQIPDVLAPHLGRCGAHFVGLNITRSPFHHDGRPAMELLREHWHRLRPEVYERVKVRAPA